MTGRSPMVDDTIALVRSGALVAAVEGEIETSR